MHKHNWAKITSDPWILQQISDYKIELSYTPFPKIVPRTIQFSSSEKIGLDTEISKFLDKKIIQEVAVPCKDQYVSTIFPREEKDGTYRFILNSKQFNEDVDHIHFKLDTLKSAIHLMKQDC